MRTQLQMLKWKRYRFEKGMRYYVLELRQNLWGEWEILKANGRIQTKLGRVKYEPCESYQAGKQQLHGYRKYRIFKRRYDEVSHG